jgi:hypothetical protein
LIDRWEGERRDGKVAKGGDIYDESYEGEQELFF